MEKQSIFKLTTKHVVAIGIGAALYAVDFQAVLTHFF